MTMNQQRVYVAIALLYFITPSASQDNSEFAVDLQNLIERRSLPSTNGNDTMSENGGVISLLIQIAGGVLQGMLDSQGITSNHVNSALNVFSPEKVHDDLILFRKTLNLALRFVTFVMRFLPRMTTNGGFSLLEYFKSKIAFYNTQPVSENGPFLGFNKILPTLRPDVPERIQKVVDFATEDSVRDQTTTPANLTDDDVRIFVKPSSDKSNDVGSTTVINITQFVNESTSNVSNLSVGISTEQPTYAPPTRASIRSSTQPLPLIRQTLYNNFNIRDVEADNDFGSDFRQIRPSRVVKKEIRRPTYFKRYF